MMDRKTDKSLLELSRKYKEAKRVPHRSGWLYKIGRGIRRVFKGNFGSVFREVQHRFSVSGHFTTKGNMDWEEPSPRLDATGLRIAVYSCVTGHYDLVTEPLYTEPELDYYLFTDMEGSFYSKWKKIDITAWKEYTELSPVQLNRKIKMLPFRYLPEYDYSIYVDGNIEIIAPMSPLVEEMGSCAFGVHYHRTRDCICDELDQIIHLMKADPALAGRQVLAYMNEGFPRHYGLYENPVLVRKHGDEGVCRLMEDWWQEYLRYPTRDQLSLPYIIWKTGYDRKNIHILGKNFSENPRFNKTRSH